MCHKVAADVRSAEYVRSNSDFDLQPRAVAVAVTWSGVERKRELSIRIWSGNYYF